MFTWKLRLVVVLQLDQSGLSLGSYQLYTGNSSDNAHQAFIEFFVTVAQLLGANRSAAAYHAENVWQLEKAVAQVFFKR